MTEAEYLRWMESERHARLARQGQENAQVAEIVRQRAEEAKKADPFAQVLLNRKGAEQDEIHKDRRLLTRRGADDLKRDVLDHLTSGNSHLDEKSREALANQVRFQERVKP